MRKYPLILIVINLITILANPPAHAQNEWEAVIFYQMGRAGALAVITPDGITETTLLPELPQIGGAWEAEYTYALSPDRRYLVVADVDFRLMPKVVDLQNFDACCVEPSPAILEDLLSAESIELGPFSPEGTQVAISYVNTFAIGGVVVMDLATGEPIYRLASEAIGAPHAVLRSWDEAGIHLMRNCWSCEPAMTGLAMVWNPVSGELAETQEFISYLYGDRLATGEYIAGRHNDRFPTVGEYATEGNVIEYYADGNAPEGQLRADERPIVYFDPENPSLPRPRWVINGAAFLIPNSEVGGTLVWRDGTQQKLDPIEGGFLTGTPDGWLMATPSGVTHVTLDGDHTISTASFDWPADTDGIQLLQAPILGQGVTFEPFAEIALADFPPIDPFVQGCPGFMPSQELMLPGSEWVVSHADGLPIHAEPTYASPEIGHLDDGATVLMDVLTDVPTCADETAWWKISAGEISGWVPEGIATEYWIVPGVRG